MKQLDLSRTVYEICTADPQAKDILAAQGFVDVVKPGLLASLGRMTTIPQGAARRGIDLAALVAAFAAAGYDVASPSGQPAPGGRPAVPARESADGRDGRVAMLKEYVRQLSAGTDMEQVRRQFVDHFRDVDAVEIAQAEQQLIDGGTPVADVQRLCDVHSALFHGATRQERIAQAEAKVAAGAASRQQVRQSAAARLIDTAGHPLAVLTAENRRLTQAIEDLQAALAGTAEPGTVMAMLEDLRGLLGHYAKKGDLIYPLLNMTYGISGPADVMWGVDDEIRDELKALAISGPGRADFKARMAKVLTRGREMVYKEENILYPLCAQQFSTDDWMCMYYEMPAYQQPGQPALDRWAQAEDSRTRLQARPAPANDGPISLGGGSMTPAQIAAVLDTIPMELSFIDQDDVNRYFNAGGKLFKRPAMAIGRSVFSCHPPKYAALARRVIDTLRSTDRASVDVWMEKGGQPVLVRYMAVRDAAGAYLGTLECVQPMGFAQQRFRQPMPAQPGPADYR